MDKHFLYFIVYGTFILLTGIIFYTFFRIEAPFAFNIFNVNVAQYYKSTSLIIGVLPSFLHTLAFCMLSIAMVKLSINNIILCGIFWFGINVAYELFSSSIYSEGFGFQFYGDGHDVISSLIGLVIFFLFAITYRKKHVGKA